MNINFDQLEIRFKKLASSEPLSPAVLLFIKDLLVCLDATEEALKKAKRTSASLQQDIHSSDEDLELTIRYAAGIVFKACQQVLVLEDSLADANENLKSVLEELEEAKKLATTYHDLYFNLLDRR